MKPKTPFLPPSLLLFVPLRSRPLGRSGRSLSSIVIVSGSSIPARSCAAAYGFDGAENGWCARGGGGAYAVGEEPTGWFEAGARE